jgi:hypothetical protein
MLLLFYFLLSNSFKVKEKLENSYKEFYYRLFTKSTPNVNIYYMCITILFLYFNNILNFHLRMSYGAVGHELNINESAVYIKQGVFKQKHT